VTVAPDSAEPPAAIPPIIPKTARVVSSIPEEGLMHLTDLMVNFF
jgi:hypothetical protein